MEPQEKSPKKAITYYRVSTEYQFKNRDTVKLQRDACKKFAKDKNIIIITEFEESEGITGKSEERPAYQAAKEALRNPEIDGLLVYDLDRWSRNKKASIITLLEFEEMRKEVYEARTGDIIDWTREGDDLISIVKSVIANREADKIKARLTMGRDRIKAGESKKWHKWNEWNIKTFTETDWEKIEKWLKLGVPIIDISDHFEVCRQTMYNKLKEHYGDKNKFPRKPRIKATKEEE